MKDLISVIVPIYNVEEYLDECIISIVNQTYKNLEIILVDDGSPDNCSKICDNWAIKDNRIKVIHKNNGGLSDARNTGLDIATGDYVSFIDSDDWISNNFIEKLLNISKYEKADIVACSINNVYSNKVIKYQTKPIIGTSNNIYPLIYCENTFFSISACNKLYKKNCWNNIRFPYGKTCEDAFTTYLLVDKANKIVQIDEPLYYYRIRENSIMTTSFSIKKMDEEEAWRNNFEFIKDYYPKLKKIAFDFYLLKVNGLVQIVPYNEYKTEYNYLLNILKKNIIYILFFSNIKIMNRIKILLNFISLKSR